MADGVRTGAAPRGTGAAHAFTLVLPGPDSQVPMVPSEG